MNFRFTKGILPSLFAITTCLQAPLFADESAQAYQANREKAYRAFLAGKPCTEEQRSKIRYEVKLDDARAQSTPMSFSWFQYKIHNGTNAKIVGIIFAVTFKNPQSGEMETLDVFSPFTLLPASTNNDMQSFYYPNLINLDPKISLKEIRLEEFPAAQN
jgi:hypothetical protein